MTNLKPAEPTKLTRFYKCTLWRIERSHASEEVTSEIEALTEEAAIVKFGALIGFRREGLSWHPIAMDVPESTRWALTAYVLRA